MRRLSRNHVQLLDLIDSNNAFLAELASPDVGCITWTQREHMIELEHSRDRNEKLLEFLTRRSVADFQKFINVLAREQAHLVPLLVTDGGKIVDETLNAIISSITIILPNMLFSTFHFGTAEVMTLWRYTNLFIIIIIIIIIKRLHTVFEAVVHRENVLAIKCYNLTKNLYRIYDSGSK